MDAEKPQPTELEPTLLDPNSQEVQEYWQASHPTNPVARAALNNIIASNQDSTFLYKTSSGQDPRFNHVVWIHNNPSNVGGYGEVPLQYWENLQTNPGLIDRTNEALLKNYDDALQLYAWHYPPAGFAIESSQLFGMEVGNILGIRINYHEIAPLIEALQTGDQERADELNKHIAASFVHELTHRERDDGITSQIQTEIASHVAQFIFDPKGNKIFDRQLESSLAKIAETRDATADQEREPLDIYPKAQYAALMIVANELAQHSEVFQNILQEDKDPHKLQALQQLSEAIGSEDEQFLRNNVLPKIMKMDNQTLFNHFKDIEKLLQTPASVTDIT